MKKCNTVSIFVAWAMTVSLLAGCQFSSEETNLDDVTENEVSNILDSNEVSEDELDDVMAEIDMCFVPMGSSPKDTQIVEDAINDITEKEINVHVKLNVIEAGNYDQQIGLMMTSGEKMDLIMTRPIGSCTFNNMASKKQFVDISTLLEEYAPEIPTMLGELLSATTVDGAVYGVPTYRNFVTGAWIVMRTDVLEDLGLLDKARNMTSFTEYEELLEAVKNSEKWNYLSGVVSSDANGLILPLAGAYLGEDKFSDAYYYDQLGDLNKVVAIDPEGKDQEIYMNYATDSYKAMIDRMQGWYEKGYVYNDSATTPDSAEILVRSDVAFSYFVESELGVDVAKSAACGYDMTCVKIIDMPISTSSCTKFTWCVPVNSTEPEATIKFMNMMYTDARIANLLAYGIENIHYQVKDGVAYYMDGEDANSCGYHTSDFQFGNQFLVLPWDGQSADFRELAKAEMDNAKFSKYLGFSCDTSNIENAITSVTNVVAEFGPSLECGMASDSDYDAFIEKLNASGVQDILAEYRKQLDEWLLEQK